MIISRPMSGKIRTARNYVQTVLILLFFVTPWLRWNGMQLIRLDIPERKFFLFGNIFAPQEGYFLHFFLIGAGLCLFLFTSLIGRVWCGWACPQTIYSDVFDYIGGLIQGSKYGKKDSPLIGRAVTHTVWFLVSALASAAWIAYFADPYLMLSYFQKFEIREELPTWTYFFGFFTLAMYADIAFVREQFCKYACPYARFQTVMMDTNSINITYDFNRGEPRRKGTTKIGDCTACNMCLVVCPTGIDIREGTNVWCIACGKCSDACTKQMQKEGKKTLIGYWSENQIKEKTNSIKWIRPRTVVYAGGLLLVLTVLSLLLWERVPLYLSVLADRNIQPVDVGDGKVRNFYEAQMQNLTLENRSLRFEIQRTDLEGVRRLWIGGTEEAVVELPANSDRRYRLFIELEPTPQDASQKSHEITLKVYDIHDPKFQKTNVVPFLLPISIAKKKNQSVARNIWTRVSNEPFFL
ncbi:cytochrome c oxidase accessory protein CcoG [Leptospira semungkisensis]|uniref:Cytochrome c oxidase accessory protein CcoG n=1 Tax=Leptospira semungkisensis TaxID=2484985 RepID=A0A4R9FM06_9LEPT|nr:cytochrome c oxidase accessory protein CcoG [Leptospira semungkisensis]TGJ99450.1 cytochrome c oxidase accessory protein CcoG [Leptospira semungkisensis]